MLPVVLLFQIAATDLLAAQAQLTQAEAGLVQAYVALAEIEALLGRRLFDRTTP